jgi:ribosomal protein L40E
MMPPDTDKKLAAVCGLFCAACHAFIGTRENPERLNAMAKRLGRPVEDLHCHGCRSETRSFFCREICTMAKCAAGKGVEFCGDCAEYPCKGLKEFQSLAPHRIELWKSQARIREAGWETWYAEMLKHYSCPHCHALNSAYDLKCRKCGEEPSCEYVGLHKDEILRHMAKIK